MHLGDSQLQFNNFGGTYDFGCDLHLGDSQLQSLVVGISVAYGCDLHLGDSQLQSPCLKCFNIRLLSFFLVKKMIIVLVLFR
ncbi:hypothetical protein [uncultured Gammaproteobacteria bacterium]|nr:hypothetical protein [uncultured Gammaproteobacteria bacterium]